MTKYPNTHLRKPQIPKPETLRLELASASERQTYRDLLHMFGPGEASCIACAASRGGTAVTDDRTARQSCGEHNIPVTGTIGILQACRADGVISTEEADGILSAMMDAGYYSPVQRISDLGG